ncbi:MAG: c-type cytochrome [Verrucomicrobiales bacterium]|nr:c-type cytochrome [Verrucomicrobiales bacterium]
MLAFSPGIRFDGGTVNASSRWCFVLVSLLSLPIRAWAEPPSPQWIWSAEGDRLGSSEFRAERTFSLSAEPDRSVLRVTADFAGVRVLINDREVVALDPHDPSAEVEVTSFLHAGENTLVIVANGVEGPSAFGLALTNTTEQGEPVVVHTDHTWPGVGSFGEIEMTRWGLNQLPEVSPFAEYNQWKEALDQPEATNLSPLPPGFEIEKIRDAGEGEDSWVSLVFDPQGRLLIGKEQKGILRLSLSDSGNEVVAAETVEDTLRECRGLAWVGETLYAHANNAKALYALRDTNGDGRFDGEEVKLVQATAGGAGHGRNALTLGPDGNLHAIVGDDIAVPEGALRRARPETGAPKELGHWVRAKPAADGSVTWEAMNRGLRNPYGIAFNADGEPFTYDADNEGDVGLPFYRPTRINHLVSGANYGWHQDRGNTRSFPMYAPDNVPTNYDAGRGSPTGVKFGTRSHFPAPWREALYALDWAYGRILAIHLTPHGASYHATGEVFLEGRPLNVTDLDFDDQGAMWFVTGGRKTKSALFRVSYTGSRRAGLPGMGEQEVARVQFSEKAREKRRALESFHGKVDPAAVAAAWPHLGDSDPWIRGAARVALEWQPVATWREKALASGGDLAGLTARLALARAGSDEDRAEVAKSAASLSLSPTANRIDRLTLLRIHELAGPSGDAAIATQLEGMKGDSSPQVQRELARAFIRIEAPGAVAYAMDRLAASVNQSDRLHYLEALAEAKSGWEPETHALFFTSLAHARRFSYGDRFVQPFFQGLEEGALAKVANEAERTKFAQRLQAPVEEEAIPAPRAMVKHWTLAELADAPSGNRTPDLARGRELYAAALCAKCHVAGTTGRPVGPDLTMVANRFSRRDLLESILDPSAVVAEVHRNVVVSKNDGSTVMGRIVQNDFRESKLTLATNPFVPSELVTIPKGEIRSWEESPVSPMPPALLDTLSREEIEDLLGFLLAGGKVD